MKLEKLILLLEIFTIENKCFQGLNYVNQIHRGELNFPSFKMK